MGSVVVSCTELQSYLEDVYAACGMGLEDARTCADCTVRTNLWGIDSHGVLRTPNYVDRLVRRVVNPAPRYRYEGREDGPVELMDGDAGMGYSVASHAMNRAISKAVKYGIGIVVVKNSNHFGAASLYARMAAQVGMIGIATTNVGPNIALPGSQAPVTGNNPLALAAPIGGQFPFSLDISMSAVSGGKLLLAQKKGEKIPTDWAIDKDGNPTDDPSKGFAGILLPMGMHKGLGLSLFIDLVTGVISGGPFLGDIRSMYKHADQPSLTSHLLCAFDPALFQSRDVYVQRVKQWTAMIRSTPMAVEGKHQVIPGELEFDLEQTRRTQGLPLPEELVKDLRAMDDLLGIGRHLAIQ